MTNLLTRARPDDWIPAADLVSGARLEELFALPERLWSAPAHAAAVLAWKVYTYRLVEPLAEVWLGAADFGSWQLPVLSAENVRVRVRATAPYFVVDLRDLGPATVVDERERLAFLRGTLVDGHLRPLMERIRDSRRISERVLWGQAAAAIAYAFADHCPGSGGVTSVVAADMTGLLPVAGLAGIGEDNAVWQTTCCLAFASPGLTACRNCVTAARRGHRQRSWSGSRRAAPLDVLLSRSA